MVGVLHRSYEATAAELEVLFDRPLRLTSALCLATGLVGTRGGLGVTRWGAAPGPAQRGSAGPPGTGGEEVRWPTA